MTIAVDGGAVARAWLAVYQASGKNADMPQLCRTLHLQQYPHGLRLVATDTFMLLSCWVPESGDLLAVEPGLDEVPYASATVVDGHGRAMSLMGYLRAVTSGDDAEKVEVRVRLNVPWQPEDTKSGDLQIDGFEALAVTVEIPDRERLQLEVYEGAWVPWQKILLRVKGVEGTQAVSVSAVLAVRLGRAAKAVDAAVMRLWFTGDSLPILVELPGATETVTGVVMPSRWNLDANAPYGEAG